jgi:Do/DeqQ family serine protease
MGSMSRYLKELAALAGAGILGMLAATAFDRHDATAQRNGDGIVREVPPSREVAQYSFSPIVRRAAPAVVNVYVQRRVQTFSSPFANDPFFRQFFGDAFGQPSERIQSSLGSGVIVSPDGIVVTNTHVIRGRGETEIRIALADKREFDAKVLTQDDKTDIAILKIENGDDRFPTLELEDSDTLEVGDMVLAIGNPFGVGQTVTSGIVSALARSEIGRSDAQVFVQTDAAINPGNSGGALVDMSGKLVGINTMIFSQSGGSQGIGFAIPSNLVRLYVQGALEGRKVERPWLGARIETVTRELAEGLGLDRVAGAVVVRVSESGPAAQAGLTPGDVITQVDGFEVADARAVHYRLTTRGIGSTVKLGIIRKGAPANVDLTLVSAPKPGRDDVRNLAGQHPLDGARVANVGPAVADELGIDETTGVVVLSVRRASTAARLGFLAGDVIAEINGQQVATVRDVEQLVAARQRMWLVSVRRGDKVFNLQVPG